MMYMKGNFIYYLKHIILKINNMEINKCKDNINKCIINIINMEI